MPRCCHLLAVLCFFMILRPLYFMPSWLLPVPIEPMKEGAYAVFPRHVSVKEASGYGAPATDRLMFFVLYSDVDLMLLPVCVIILSVIVHILLII